MERRSSISEIPKIISETLHKEGQKGIISIGNVFSRILRKYKYLPLQPGNFKDSLKSTNKIKV